MWHKFSALLTAFQYNWQGSFDTSEALIEIEHKSIAQRTSPFLFFPYLKTIHLLELCSYLGKNGFSVLFIKQTWSILVCKICRNKTKKIKTQINNSKVQTQEKSNKWFSMIKPSRMTTWFESQVNQRIVSSQKVPKIELHSWRLNGFFPKALSSCNFNSISIEID